METLPEEKQVIELISKLKNSSGTYPKDMLYSRRQKFLRQVASAGLGMEIGKEVKNAAKQGQGAGSPAATIATSKIIEIILIAAIVVEAGVISYTYRNKITNFFKALRETPGASEPVQQPSNNISPSLPEILPTLTPPATSSTPTNATLIYTPVPPVQQNNNTNTTSNDANAGNDSNPGSNGNNATATPLPTDSNGNHYGQTPKPQQTKENNVPNNASSNNIDVIANIGNGNGNGNTNGNNGKGNK